MKKYIYLTVAVLLCSYPLLAQDWINMMKDQNANVHDVQKAFYNWYSAQPDNDLKPGENENEENGNYTLFRRWEWLMEARTFPTGVRPNLNAISEEYRNFLSQKASERTANTQSNANWTYVGNTSVPPAGPSGNFDGGAGRVNYFRFMPGNSNIIYACCPTGGLWKTTDGGVTWGTNTDQLTDLSISDVAIDPVTTSTMYVSTGDGDGIFGGYTTLTTVGVLKSTDGGNTWNPTGLTYQQALTGPAYSTVNQLLIQPVKTNIILAAASFGLYRTTNSGTSWTRVDTGDFKSIEYEPFHSGTIYASTNNGQFYRSVDTGATWTLITAGLPAYQSSKRVKIAVTPADSNYVYVLEWTSSGSGIYLSKDRGQTFTLRENSFDPIGNQGWYNLGFNVSQTNADSLLAGGLDIYASPDTGKTWNLVAEWTNTGAPYVHADVHCISWLPGSGGTYFASCDGGFFRYKMSAPGAWANLSNGLSIAEIYSIGPSAKTAGLWITGWQDNGVNISSPSWSQVLGGDGMVSFIDHSNDSTWFAENYDGNFQISTNQGATWSPIPAPTKGTWVTKWMQDPMNASTLYGCRKDLVESTNKGATWSKIGTWGTSSMDFSAVAVDPSNDKIIYAARPNQIERTSNNGTSWTNITTGLPVGSAGITDIAVASDNPAFAVVTFSGYVSTAKVFVTSDSGATWTNISSGLPNLPVNCVLYQGNNGFYVGTDAGVYFHDYWANAWVSYNTGLPNVIINDLKYTAAPNTIIAATYGRGVWSSPSYVLGVNEVSDDSYVKIYPNPTNGKLNLVLDLPANGQYTVSVWNLLGQVVYTNKINVNGHYTGDVNLSNAAKGTYILGINGKGYRTSKKIVVN